MPQPGRPPAPVRRHLEREWQEERRAEARLHQRLRALETARLVHAQLRAWEQRQLSKELRRLQAEIIRRGRLYPRDARERPLQARHPEGTGQAGPPRAPAASRPRELPALQPGPPDPAEEPGPEPCQGGEGTASSPAPSPGGAGDPGDAHPVPGHRAGPPQPEGTVAAPTGAELLARAGRARYIRHRAPPPWEQPLSVHAVFGHQDAEDTEDLAPPTHTGPAPEHRCK